MPDDSPDQLAQTTTRHQSRLLGTNATITVTTRGTSEHGDEAIDSVIATIGRLEAIFSVFDPGSDLVRFRRGEPGPFAPELMAVLDSARFWHDASDGAFNPHAGAITNLWSGAASSGHPPPEGELRDLVARLDALAYDDSPYLNLNAIAKGWIVDEAIRLAFQIDDALDSIWINLGGDIAHRGHGALTVALEDPRTPYDNAPPLTRITIANQAVASSGGGRRGIAGGVRRLGHIIDPRCGYPVDPSTGATVIADAAAEADVIATILTVLAKHERRDFLAGLSRSVAYIVVGEDHSVETSPNFGALEVPVER